MDSTQARSAGRQDQFWVSALEGRVNDPSHQQCLLDYSEAISHSTCTVQTSSLICLTVIFASDRSKDTRAATSAPPKEQSIVGPVRIEHLKRSILQRSKQLTRNLDKLILRRYSLPLAKGSQHHDRIHGIGIFLKQGQRPLPPLSRRAHILYPRSLGKFRNMHRSMRKS